MLIRRDGGARRGPRESLRGSANRPQADNDRPGAWIPFGWRILDRRRPPAARSRRRGRAGPPTPPNAHRARPPSRRRKGWWRWWGATDARARHWARQARAPRDRRVSRLLRTRAAAQLFRASEHDPRVLQLPRLDRVQP